MRNSIWMTFFAFVLSMIAIVAQADEPSIIVKKDGSVSLHCSIAVGKDGATFNRLFGENATVHGNCSDSKSGGTTVVSGGTGTNPNPVPRGGGGGGVAPVCVCPESMIAVLSDSLGRFESDGDLLPETLTWQDPELWVDQTTYAPFDTIAAAPNRIEYLGHVEGITQGGVEIVQPYQTPINDAQLRALFGSQNDVTLVTPDSDGLGFDWIDKGNSLEGLGSVEQGRTFGLRGTSPLLNQNSHSPGGFNAQSFGQ